MSIKHVSWAFEQEGLKSGTKMVLVALADSRNSTTGQLNPRQSTLAKKCGMSRASVNTHLQKLEDLGLIIRHAEVDPKTRKQRVTRYTLAKDLPDSDSPDSGSSGQSVGSASSSSAPSAAQDVGGPSQKFEHGSESKIRPFPCPEFRKSRVQNSDTKNREEEPEDKPTPNPLGKGARRNVTRFGVPESAKNPKFAGGMK